MLFQLHAGTLSVLARAGTVSVPAACSQCPHAGTLHALRADMQSLVMPKNRPGPARHVNFVNYVVKKTKLKLQLLLL